MTEGDEKANEALRVRPLLPIESDRRLARVVAEVAERHYPESWVRRSNELGRLRVAGSWVDGAIYGLLSCVVAVAVGLVQGFSAWFAIGSGILLGAGFGWLSRRSSAGLYRRLGGGLLVVGWGAGGTELRGAIVHELGHRMQHAVPGLVEEERAFLEEKMGRSVRVLPRPVAAFGRLAREIAVGVGLLKRSSHGLFHQYAAQDPMNGRDYEVFTMGYQATEYGARNPFTGRFDPDMRPFPDHEASVKRVLREL